MVARATQTIDRRLVEKAKAAPRSTVEATTRLLGAVAQHTEEAPFVDRVLDVLTEATDARGRSAALAGYEALLALLEQPEALAELRRHDPLAPARVRGLGMQARILSAEGGTCTAEQLAGMLGMTRQGVDKRRTKGRLIALDLGRRGYAYPIWQVGLAGLEDVLAELADVDAWSQATFMLTPNAWLEGETPLALLRRGEVERVRDAAGVYGEQIAA
jgi:hypothetical protein